MDKDKIFQEVRQEVLDEIKRTTGTPAEFHLSGACLYFAHYTLRRLKKEGFNAVIQAGTACWPRICKSQDDGFTHTHFSYVWELSDRTKARLMAGYLPEMHVWVGIIDTQEIVDFTVGLQPEQCKRMGCDWPGPPAPDYIWANKLPDGVVYEPNALASACANAFWANLCK